MTSDAMSGVSKRGRPRDQNSRIAILAAAATLVRDVGYDGVTMEGIAAAARVGKQTIYRWWPTKAAVIADAFIDGHVPFPQSVLARTPDLWADLESWMRAGENGFDGDYGDFVRITASVAAADKSVASRMIDRFAQPSRALLLDRLELAIETGQLKSDLDLDAVVDLLQAVVTHAGLTRADSSVIVSALTIIRAAAER